MAERIADNPELIVDEMKRKARRRLVGAMADIEALRPLYDDADFATFAGFGGYIGYRVGILSDGTWVYFVAGD